MFIQQVVNTINKYHLLQPGERVVIAVSGGADSVALLYTLMELQPLWKFELHLAHLNHMFRPKEAEQDAGFVRKLAQQHKLPHTIESFDVPTYQRQHKLSPQAAARQIRYQFLNRVAEDTGATKIALGHTANDQAETMLMRIIQGTGLQGLSGIPPQRKRYIRPLIETSRGQIEAYLKQQGIGFRQDASNLSPKYLRNKIRLQLIPQLEREYNPNLRNSLTQLAQVLRAEQEWSGEYLKRLLPQIVECSSCAVSLKLAAFNQQSLAISRRILRWAIHQLKGDLEQISFSHIEQLLQLARSRAGYKTINLPQQIVAKKGYQTLELTQLAEDGTPLHYDYPLVVPGITPIPPLQLEIETQIVERTKVTLYPKGNEAGLDWNKLKPPLNIRNRKPGDRFSPLGASGAKKLKDFLIDQKIPQRQRDQIPLLVMEEKILWVAGYRINERYKIGPETKRVLWLQMRETS